MTRRERMESRAERRAEWAAKADARAEAAFGAAKSLADQIPFGQPILVGHHSQRKAERDADRIHNRMRRGVEAMDLAAHHRSTAAHIESALERSIFSDDRDAVEQLEARIAEREAECAHRVAVNKAWAKLTSDIGARIAALVEGGTIDADEALKIARLFQLCPWEKKPWPSYALSNAHASIRRDRERLAQIRGGK